MRGTVSGGTQPGVVLGTMGYMSPEQVRGKPADKRSDLFSFGTILYEMLAGQRAFRGDTAADTITAILTKEPPDLSQTNKDVSPGLDRIVRHCLEKNPEERFESARDVAFDLEALSGSPEHPRRRGFGRFRRGRGVVPGRCWQCRGSGRVRRPLVYSAGKKAGVVSRPSSTRSPFRGGKSPVALRAGRSDRRLFRILGRSALRDLHQSSGEPGIEAVRASLRRSPRHLEVRRDGGQAGGAPRRTKAFVTTGRLARISIAGGAPRDILDDVQYADWSPDGKDLAIIRDVGGEVSARVSDRQGSLRDFGLDQSPSDLPGWKRSSPSSTIRSPMTTVESSPSWIGPGRSGT